MKKSPVVHFEMPYKDAKRVSEFYSKVFGWGMNQAGVDMGHYIVAETTEVDEKTRRPKESGAINGGFFMWDEKTSGRNIPSFVISVENLNEAMEGVKSAGGKIENEPQDIPGIGMWAVFTDTEGNRVSLLEAVRK